MLADLLIAALPWRLKRLAYRRRGWSVHPSASIGFSVLSVGHLVLGRDARIGHGNLFLRVKEVRLGDEARIGSLNRFSGPADVAVADRVNTAHWPSRLVLGERTLVFNSNFFDVAGEIEIGAGTVFAGGFSRVWSHEPVERGNGVRAVVPRAVTVGRDTYVGAGSTLLPGTTLPDRCVLGAASVLTKSAAACAPGTILAGNPARTIRSTDEAV